MSDSHVIPANKKPKGGGWRWPTFWQVKADEAKDVTPAVPFSIDFPVGVKEMINASYERKFGGDFRPSTDCEYVGAWLATAEESELFFQWVRSNTSYVEHIDLMYAGVKRLVEVLTDFHVALPKLKHAVSSRRSAQIWRAARRAKRARKINL